MYKRMFARIKPRLFECLFYLLIFIFSLISYVIFKPIIFGNEAIGRGVAAKCYAIVLLLIIVFVGVMLFANKKLDRKKLIFLIILAGFVIRLGYVLYTEGIARQYDTYDYGAAHFDYAKILFQTGKLPNNNDYQFYHPPLNALVQSSFMHFISGFFNFINSYFAFLTGNKGIDMTVESYFYACQLLSLLYTVITTVTACKIFRELNLNGFGGMLAIVFVAFYPRLVQFSGQLNNDVLCFMLMTISLYLAIKFYKNQSWVNIVATALAVGFTLMTKLNGATICLPIAILFIITFVKRIRGKEKKEITDIVIKYGVFILICAPIGLWFQIYAKIRFNQPFGYVFPYLNGELSVSDRMFIERFLFPHPLMIFRSVYASAWDDCNLIDYTMKSSIFGEFSYWNGDLFAIISVLLNYLYMLSLIAAIAMFFFDRYIKGKKIFDLPFILFGSLGLTMVGCQFFFNLKMPYGCTMDFRYIMPLIIASAGLSGLMWEEARTAELKGYKTTVIFHTFTLFAFILSSSLFYLTCI